MSDFYIEKPNETPEQQRFRIFAMTHREPTRAADEWIEDKQRIALLEKVTKDVLERMDRARMLLTNGKPTPANNWGMLDTADLRRAAGYLEITK